MKIVHAIAPLATLAAILPVNAQTSFCEAPPMVNDTNCAERMEADAAIIATVRVVNIRIVLPKPNDWEGFSMVIANVEAIDVRKGRLPRKFELRSTPMRFLRAYLLDGREVTDVNSREARDAIVNAALERQLLTATFEERKEKAARYFVIALPGFANVGDSAIGPRPKTSKAEFGGHPGLDGH